jgi:hypothetical protein
VKKDTAATSLPGLSFAYTFDTLGNHTQAVSNAQTSAYSLKPGGLNQYVTRTVPGVLDVVGTASASASVTVNFQPTQRSGEAFWSQLAVNNSAGPVWQNVSIIAANPASNAIVKQTGNTFIPSAVETYAHDLDGNLIRSTRSISKYQTSRFGLFSALEVGRKVSAWAREPDATLHRKLQ